MVPRRDQHPHRLPRGERLGEEASGADVGALVLVEVAADRDRRASQLAGEPAGAGERLAKPLTPPPCELGLAAHGGERPVEVQVGEMEKTHALLRAGVHRDRGRTSVRTAYHTVIGSNFCDNRVGTDAIPMGRRPGITFDQGWGSGDDACERVSAFEPSGGRARRRGCGGQGAGARRPAGRSRARRRDGCPGRGHRRRADPAAVPMGGSTGRDRHGRVARARGRHRRGRRSGRGRLAGLHADCGSGLRRDPGRHRRRRSTRAASSAPAGASS